MVGGESSIEDESGWYGQFSAGFLIFKVLLVPRLVMPLLAMLLARALMDKFIRLVTLLFLEVSMWNIAGITRYVTTSRDAGPYSFLEVTGILSLMLFGALVLIVIWERMAASITAQGVHFRDEPDGGVLRLPRLLEFASLHAYVTSEVTP